MTITQDVLDEIEALLTESEPWPIEKSVIYVDQNPKIPPIRGQHASIFVDVKADGLCYVVEVYVHTDLKPELGDIPIGLLNEKGQLMEHRREYYPGNFRFTLGGLAQGGRYRLILIK